MRAVLTAEIARQITHGRTPLVPVEYETAVKALAECCTLDESKYWSQKADALAAWAKIYRQDDALRKAKMLKLHAFRRMGQLSEELRPVRKPLGAGSGRGTLPGPRSLLREQGLSVAETAAARMLGGLELGKFKRLLSSPRPLAPTTARYMTRPDEASIWHDIQRGGCSFRSVMRRHDSRVTASVPSLDSGAQRLHARDVSL